MKTKILTITLLLTLLFSATGINEAYAQEPECRDAAGAVIPCPPTEPSTGGGGSDNGSDDNDDNSGGSGNQNPPVTAATPTSTPLPLAAPTEAESTAKAEWSGICKDTTCISQFTNGCTSVGGSVTIGEIKDGEVPLTCKVPSVLPATPRPLTAFDSDYLGSCTNENFAECREQFKCEDGLLVIKVDLYAAGGTTYDFYCIPDEVVPQLNLPLAVPTNDGATENWEGICLGDNLSSCSDTFKALCDEEGGNYSEFYEDNGGLYAVCENSSETSPVATEAPAIVAAPQDNSTTGDSWEEECSWGTCWMADISCWMDGGTGYGVQDAAGNLGYHCDLPSNANTSPPSPWLPWITVGGLVILIGLLLPAVQKIREAAARTGPQTKEHVLLNKEDPQEAKKIFLGGLSAKPDEPSEAKSKPKPPPPPPPPPPSGGGGGHKDWIEIQSFSLGTTQNPTTNPEIGSEDIKGEANNASASKPKPKPKPTPPPSQPKPSTGDFSSDGSVDGSDFNP